MLTLQYILDNSLNQSLIDAVNTTPDIVEKQIKSIEKLLSFLCVDRYLALWKPRCRVSCGCGEVTEVLYPTDIQDLIMYLLEQKYYTTIVPWSDDCTTCYDPNVQSMSMPWGFSITYKDDTRFPSYYKIIGGITIPSDYYKTLEKYDCKNLLIAGNINV